MDFTGGRPFESFSPEGLQLVSDDKYERTKAYLGWLISIALSLSSMAFVR